MRNSTPFSGAAILSCLLALILKTSADAQELKLQAEETISVDTVTIERNLEQVLLDPPAAGFKFDNRDCYAAPCLRWTAKAGFGFEPICMNKYHAGIISCAATADAGTCISNLYSSTMKVICFNPQPEI